MQSCVAFEIVGSSPYLLHLILILFHFTFFDCMNIHLSLVLLFLSSLFNLKLGGSDEMENVLSRNPEVIEKHCRHPVLSVGKPRDMVYSVDFPSENQMITFGSLPTTLYHYQPLVIFFIVWK